jgi:2-C-methyl-D-erythritol 4-phosphate cytidylyltransferase
MKSARYAIVVAAGSGKRMGAPLPKQFLEVKGRPLLMHTLTRLHEFDASMNVLLVLHPDYFSYWKEEVVRHAFQLPHTIIAGGEERFHSVKCALDAIEDMNAIVGIHDGVRPLVSVETLTRCFDAAEEHGNAVPVVPVNDSLREISENGNHGVDRSRYRIVQTPQCYRVNLLKQAFNSPFRSSFTDDASVFESTGNAIHLVEGNRDNLKITTPEDLRLLESMLAGR